MKVNNDIYCFWQDCVDKMFEDGHCLVNGTDLVLVDRFANDGSERAYVRFGSQIYIGPEESLIDWLINLPFSAYLTIKEK